jgi:hypothetical protein
VALILCLTLMEQDNTEHFNIHRKRAAVEVYREAKRFRREESGNSISPLSMRLPPKFSAG